MKFFQDLILGYKSYIDAIKFIKVHKLWYYFIFPVLLFLCIYYLGFVFQGLKHDIKIDDETGWIYRLWLMFLRSLYSFLAVIMFSFMRYVLIILLSPVLSIVSERVERILTGNKYKFNFKQLIKDIKRAINLAIRNIVWELGIVYSIILIYSIFSWMIGLSDAVDDFVTGGIAMVVAFYYYGFGFIDYLMERMRMNLQESVKFVRQRRGFAVALGSVFTLIFVYSNEYLLHVRESVHGTWLLVLVLTASIILAMIPIITMVAATLGVNQIADLSKNPFASREEALNPEKINPDEPQETEPDKIVE